MKKRTYIWTCGFILGGTLLTLAFQNCGKMSGSDRSFSATELDYISPQYLANTGDVGVKTDYSYDDIHSDFETVNPNVGDPTTDPYDIPVENPTTGEPVVDSPVVQPLVTSAFYWKCVFDLQGEKGAQWRVERHMQFDDSCQRARKVVQTNNPKAKILLQESIFMGYHDDGTQLPYHWKCEFVLRGKQGNQWRSERHLKFDDNCATATATVKLNNPNATILSVNEVFIGYHTDATPHLYFYKCQFRLRGEKGAQWDVQRMLKFDDDCKTATDTVKANNPKATILSVKEIFVGYHGEKAATDDNKPYNNYVSMLDGRIRQFVSSTTASDVAQKNCADTRAQHPTKVITCAN